MLVEKHPKHGTLLFGRFKPRFFVIIFALVIVALSYLYLTGTFKDWQIQLSYYNSSVIGNGQSSVTIPFTILEGTEEPITVPIQVQSIASIGSVSTNCTSPSTCEVKFSAPRTAKTEYANISINVGGVSNGATKVVQIEVTPDKTASLMLSVANQSFYLSENNSLYTYSKKQESSTKVIGYGYDSGGNPVPDGTTIDFNVSVGTLSESSCTTKGGSCSVTYNLPNEAGVFEINGSSYNASYVASVNITHPKISSFITIYNDSLREVSHSEMCAFAYCAYYNYTLNGSVAFNVQVTDSLNEPVQNVHVAVYQNNLGNGEQCFTSATGQCNVQFVENEAGIYDNSNSAYEAANNGQASYNPSVVFDTYINNSTNPQSATLTCAYGLNCSYK